MRYSMQPFVAALFGAAVLAALPAAQAQSPQPAQSPMPAEPQAGSQQTAPAPAIPSQKLDAAAAAIGRVADLNQHYQQQMAAAAPSDKPRIAAEANTAMTKAVTDQGLSVEEYNSILEAAQTNPSVREQLVARMHPAPSQ